MSAIASDLDAAALARWFSAHVPGFSRIDAVERFRGGQSNPTYRIRTPECDYVLRSKPAPAARLLPSAHAIEREFTIQQALAGSDVPVARMVGLCEDESVIGRAFYVMQHIDGRIFWDPTLPGLSPDARAAVFDEMNRVISALHRIDPAAVGLSDYGKAGNYFARQIDRWSKQYRASELEPIAAMDALIEWLPAHIPAETTPQVSLVHGDFRIDNLIFAKDEARVLAVIDWELSTLGHPLADLAYHTMVWHLPAGVLRGLAGQDIQALGIPSEAEHVRRYVQRTGRVIEGDWNFHLAYNLFRIAAILQGVAKRAQAGTASSEQAVAYGAQARPLAELGWQFAQRVQD